MHSCVSICPDVNGNVESGSLHGLIGVNVNANAIEQPQTLIFLHKFGERKTCHIRILHTACVESEPYYNLSQQK